MFDPKPVADSPQISHRAFHFYDDSDDDDDDFADKEEHDDDYDSLSSDSFDDLKSKYRNVSSK